jgi:hypothetical protein
MFYGGFPNGSTSLMGLILNGLLTFYGFTPIIFQSSFFYGFTPILVARIKNIFFY